MCCPVVQEGVFKYSSPSRFQQQFKTMKKILCLLLLLLLKCVQKPFLAKWFVAATLPHLFFLLLKISSLLLPTSMPLLM